MFDIERLESIAMFDFADDEREMLRGRAQALANSFDEIGDIDTEGILPLVSVLDICNILRDDVAEQLLTRDEILANAPEQYDGFFKVPGTLE